MTIEILDWRDEQLDPPALVRGKRKHRLGPNGKVVKRKASAIDGIVIHQTACTFGPSDDAQRRHERAFGVACHALAFRDGTVVLPNPLRSFVLHGNKLNDRSLGLECEGLLSGLRDDPATAPKEHLQTTWGGKPDDVTDLLVETARTALAKLVELGRAEGMPIRFIWAHRQSSGQRPSDPGQELWERVVLGYAVPVLGLSTEPARWWPSMHEGKPSNGRPIPKAWDPAGVGKY